MKEIKHIGYKQLLERRKTLFLCSKKTPIGCYERVFGWVDSLTDNDCVMCCDTTEMEAEVLKALLVGGVPTILAVMNDFRDRNNIQIARALEEGRLLIMVLKRDEPRGSGATPRLRNQYLISIADRIVCGYVNPNGSVFPLLAGLKNVEHIEFEQSMLADEGPKIYHRWTVGEDKLLLRMFYEDMGIHAIKRNLPRPYSAIRERLRSLTFSEEVLKGREFEDYVLELFNVRDSDVFVLKEWQGDKTIGGVCPENNRNPDFVFECASDTRRRRRFAVECKWRSRLGIYVKSDLLTDEKLDIYTRFSRYRRMPVFLILGVGGVPEILSAARPLTDFLRTQSDTHFMVTDFLP